MIAPRNDTHGIGASSERRAIVAAVEDAERRGVRCALATVVSVDGSSYRRPGARMLVREDGTSVGTISAGCLERDVVEHARQVMRTGTASLLEYETATTDNEVAWGLGLGCGGTVRVLVEALDADSAYLATLRRVDDGAALLVATVYDVGTRDTQRCAPRVRVAVGARLIVDASGHLAPSDMSDDVAAVLAREVATFAGQGIATDMRIAIDGGGSVGILVEELVQPVPVVIFGAGPDVVPLVRLAQELGWCIEVVDPQAHAATPLRFRAADRVTLARPEELATQLSITPQTMALVMTHNYVHDRTVLDFLLASPARYIGVMGPAQRTQRMLRELEAEHPDQRIAQAGLARLHAPVGLDIGADGPFEIALSIVAEMRAVVSGRRGAMLRERRDAIHPRADAGGVESGNARVASAVG